MVPNLLIVVLGQPTPNLGWDLGTEKNGIKKSVFFKVLEKKGIAQKNLVSTGLPVSLAWVRLHCLILTLQDQASSF